MSIVLGGAVWFAGPTARASTPLIRGDMSAGTVGASVGLDPTWVADFHYAKGLRLSRAPDKSRVHLRIGVPLLLLSDFGGARFDVGWTERLSFSERFGLTLSPKTGLTMTQDPTGRKIGWIIDLSTQPGFYRKGLTIAANFGWRTAAATHHSYSDAALDLFEDRYPEDTDAAHIRDSPENGWVHFGAHHIRAGVVAGASIRNMIEIWAGLGIDYMPQYQGVLFDRALGHTPVYADLGVNYRW